MTTMIIMKMYSGDAFVMMKMNNNDGNVNDNNDNNEDVQMTMVMHNDHGDIVTIVMYGNECWIIMMTKVMLVVL